MFPSFQRLKDSIVKPFVTEMVSPCLFSYDTVDDTTLPMIDVDPTTTNKRGHEEANNRLLRNLRDLELQLDQDFDSMKRDNRLQVEKVRALFQSDEWSDIEL